jgi:hypothetical protein
MSLSVTRTSGVSGELDHAAVLRTALSVTWADDAGSVSR